MDKNLITLYELQLYIKSWGNSNNERVKTFLDNVFQMGISLRYDDIFPMEEFEYGDLLILDQEFIYNEYLKFLEKNELVDDVLFHIAENGPRLVSNHFHFKPWSLHFSVLFV